MFGILEGVLNSLHDQKLVPLRKEILTGKLRLRQWPEYKCTRVYGIEYHSPVQS